LILLPSQVMLSYFGSFVSDARPIVAQNAYATTLPDFNFGAAGDWGCTTDTTHTVENIISKSTELVLGLGDYSYASTADCWFSTTSLLYNQTKVAIGNHEYDHPGKLEQHMNHFQLKEQFYSFDYQNVHFIAMSTESPFDSTSGQYNFVKNDLAAAASNPEIGWIVVYFHHPMYLSSHINLGNSPLPALRDTYHPLFDQYNVDLVLQAHHQAYERTLPIRYNSTHPSQPIVTDRTSASSYNDPQGQIYVTAGTGGQSLDYNFRETSFSATQFTGYGFLNIDIINEGSAMRGRFYGNDGTIRDQFTIVKAPPENNNPPVAHLGADPTRIDEGRTSSLDASLSSDSDGDSLTYAFRQIAGTKGTITVNEQSPSRALFHAPALSADEVATIEVTIDDGRGGVKTATIDIAVSEVEAEACNCVIFRLDDVGDYSFSNQKRAVMDLFISKNQELVPAIVMGHFGNDSAIVDKVREGYDKGLFELTIHGWDHVKFPGNSMEQQKTWLNASNAKLTKMFGRASNVFVPPLAIYNTDTLIAMSQLGYRILSVENDSEPYPQFKADASGDHDSYGIYHLPHSAKFFDYSTNVGVKVPVDELLSDIDAGIEKYGYTVVVMHPQDFGIVVDGKPTKEVDQTQIDDLNYIIDAQIAKGRTITTFSKVVGLELPSIDDTIAPSIKAPADIATVKTGTLTEVSLGAPAVRDNVDPSPVITNDAPADGFPLGTMMVTWVAQDASGNTANASQHVTIAETDDTTLPVVSITSPRSGTAMKGPSTGVVVTVAGTASDAGSGIKLVELTTGSLIYEPVTPKAPGDWSTWQKVVTIKDEGTVFLRAKTTDYFGNVKWSIQIPIALTFEDGSGEAPSIYDGLPSITLPTPETAEEILDLVATPETAEEILDLVAFQPMLLIIPAAAIPSVVMYIVWRRRSRRRGT
jgi:peptidoglycan/xylan/chitin deacetylase (PgdA/CDA1 family)